ncbi:MAG TPA: hypothetical protein VFW11_14605 [Cyclobacteriaceae bacterium]|nr:hypothetical protein [Cyclobacteriaceae bacterium]
MGKQKLYEHLLSILATRSILANLFVLGSASLFSQSNLSVAVPFIVSDVEVTNVYGPMRQIKGTGYGYGFSIAYSFSPKILISDNNFQLSFGLGYFRQLFDIERPFHFDSPAEVLFYTDRYSYDNLLGTLGLRYSYELNDKYRLTGVLSYSRLHSFRQKYIPTYSTGSDDDEQIENKKFVFGDLVTVTAGIFKQLNYRYSITFELAIPLFTQWRKDEIFEEDASEHFSPKISLGTNVSLRYTLGNSHN